MATRSIAQVKALLDGIAGPVLVEGDAGYEEVRRVHNGLVDKRPSVIARCAGVPDVALAVRAARDAGLEIAVRGGGHNASGKAVTDGGVMIDLSLMKRVDVDPATRTITAQGGVVWAELNDAAHAHGLATTGGVVSTTGVAGLTLGGGIGWTMGAYGMSLDNLLSAELVAASGDVVTASEQTEPDLFWAIRGGGGNFGAATSLTFRAYPLETVLGGAVVHALSDAAAAMRDWRDVASSMPDEMSVQAALRHAPDGSGAKIFGVAVCHVGTPNVAERDVDPLRRSRKPMVDMVGRMPYPSINRVLDADFPAGDKYYWKSAFFADLSDAAIEGLVDAFASLPNETSLLVLEAFSGAATRVEPTATAFPHRSPGFNLIIISRWFDPAETDGCISWARGTFDALRPHMADRAYVNYLDADDAGRVRSAYGPNYGRLVELKRRYDPDNVFRLNQNIVP